MAPKRPNADAPRRRYRRITRAAKLPKMNNSERGKYYRQKYKEHERGLEDSVTKLRKQVHDLELFLRVKHELAFRNPYDDVGSIVGLIFEYFVRGRANGLQYDASFQGKTTPRSTAALDSEFDLLSMDAAATRAEEECKDAMPSTFLFFDLVSLHVEGCVDAPVVVMRGMVHAKYTLAAIDRLFPHLIHYQDLLDVLLDREVRYPCTYHFCFGSGGTFENKIVEADYIHGLQQVVGNLEDVMWLLNGSHRYTERRDSLEDILRGPRTMAMDFISA